MKTAEAQAKRIVALAGGAGQGESLQRQTLTPLLVENNAINRLNPNVTVIITNGNTVSTISASDLNKDAAIGAATTKK